MPMPAEAAQLPPLDFLEAKIEEVIGSDDLAAVAAVLKEARAPGVDRIALKASLGKLLSYHAKLAAEHRHRQSPPATPAPAPAPPPGPPPAMSRLAAAPAPPPPTAVAAEAAPSGGLQPATATQRADRAFVLAAVEEAGGDLRYAAGPLKGDREVVLAAVTQSGGALWHASAKLKADPEVVLAAVKEDGGALWYASAKLKRNRDFALKCVAVDGNSLRYFAAPLKADREIVLTALKQDHTALRYGSADLQADREIVQAARPPESTPEPVVVVHGQFEGPSSSPEEALDAARLGQQRRAAGLRLRAEDAGTAAAAGSGRGGLELVLHRRDSSVSSNSSNDEDFATVREYAVGGLTGGRPIGAHHRRLGSRDSELDGASSTPPSTPSKDKDDSSSRHISFQTAGLIGLALTRAPSKTAMAVAAAAAETPREELERRGSAGSSSSLTRNQTAPLPPMLSNLSSDGTPPRTPPQLQRPHTSPPATNASVSFAPGTELQRTSTIAVPGGQRRRRSSFRLQVEYLMSPGVKEITEVEGSLPDKLSPSSAEGKACNCIRQKREIFFGLMRCAVCLFCCCGLPLVALTAMATGAVTDCSKVVDGTCWETFFEEVAGVNHQYCKSERSCDELIQEFNVNAAGGEPVERSDDAVLETTWRFVEEKFGLDEITCIEGDIVTLPEAEAFDLGAECSGTFVQSTGTFRAGALTVANGSAYNCSDVYVAEGDGRESSCPKGCEYTGVCRGKATLAAACSVTDDVRDRCAAVGMAWCGDSRGTGTCTVNSGTNANCAAQTTDATCLAESTGTCAVNGGTNAACAAATTDAACTTATGANTGADVCVFTATAADACVFTAGVCVPEGFAAPDCSGAYLAAAPTRAEERSLCPAGCTFTSEPADVELPPSRCMGQPVTQSKAESICRQLDGRLCTGYELWRSGTGCFSGTNRAGQSEGPFPVWTRTPAAAVFSTIGLMTECPTVDETEEESVLYAGYRGIYPEDRTGQLECLDGTQELGLVRCCADTETQACESDRTEAAYDDGSWQDDGSWNTTSTDKDAEKIDRQRKIVIAGSASLAWCLCLMWVCFLGRKSMFERWEKRERKREAAVTLQEKEEMRMYGINQELTGDIEDQQMEQARRNRSLSGLATLRLKGLTDSPRPTGASMKRILNGRKWGESSPGAPGGCSLSDLPDSAKIWILSHTADCAELARLSVVCKWWWVLHRSAASHVNIRWSKWEESNECLDAICHVLPSYQTLTSVDIVADEPKEGCRTKPDPTNLAQPTLVVGTCAASAALWEYASIKSLTLRAAPRMYDPWGQSRMGGRMANAGAKSTGAVWHLDRNFTRVVARSKSLVSLDLRRSTFDQIPGWPVSLEVLCLQQCTRMEVMPGASHTLRSLISLDLSLCPALYDISVLLGAASLQWLDLSGCTALSEISPIAGCAELRTLNLNRCFSLREVSALGTLTKLATLDLSSCPLVDDVGILGACETAQIGGSWCRALSRVDLSYTAVTDVACLAPIEALDGSLFQGCPELITLTIRGCKDIGNSDGRTIMTTEENVNELLEALPMLHVDLDSPDSSSRNQIVDAQVPKHIRDSLLRQSGPGTDQRTNRP